MDKRVLIIGDEKKLQSRMAARAIVDAIKAPKEPVVPRRQFVADLLTMVKGTEFTDEELTQLYIAVRDKCKSKTCCRCGRMAVLIDGDYIYSDGDMSKPKKFRCYLCKDANS
jgi:hypothetical protein